MDAPSASTIYDRSALLKAEFDDAAAADPTISEAESMVLAITWRVFGDTAVVEEERTYEPIPTHLEAVALRAFRLKAEEVTVGDDIEQSESAASSSNLKGFSAGPYSEQYFGPGETAKSGALSPNAALNEALLALMTEDAKAQWMADVQGRVRPASEVVTQDFSAEPAYGNISPPYWP